VKTSIRRKPPATKLDHGGQAALLRGGPQRCRRSLPTLALTALSIQNVGWIINGGSSTHGAVPRVCVAARPHPVRMTTRIALGSHHRGAPTPVRRGDSVMTEQRTSQYGRVHEKPASGLAVGFTVFAGVIMIMAGAFQAITGLVAIFENEFYATTRNYILQFDVTTWGWIHMLLGLVILFAGFGVLSGQTWGRVVGIILAGVSALANFAFIPYYPVWSLVIIALDVFVIWALAAHGRDITR
jgi:hypothetical protein